MRIGDLEQEFSALRVIREIAAPANALKIGHAVHAFDLLDCFYLFLNVLLTIDVLEDDDGGVFAVFPENRFDFLN